MAHDEKRLKTVAQAVDSALMDLGEDRHRFEQFLHWGLEAARDWHMDMAKEVKTVSCVLLPYKAIDLPDDYVDWTKIGVRCGDTIKTFTHDNNIALEHDCIDGVLQENPKCDMSNLEPTGIWYAYYNWFNYYGEDVGRLYGEAYHDNGLGYFRVHLEKRQIQFRGLIPGTSKIYLEYISDGWSPCEETLLHPYAFKLIKLYIHWMNLKYNQTKPRILVREAKDEYWEEFDKVQYRMFEFTVEDVLEVSREAYVPTPQT